MCPVPISAVFWVPYILCEPGNVESSDPKSFSTVSSAPTTIVTTFVFMIQHLDISICRSRYLQIFSDVFDTMLVSDGNEVSTRVHFFFCIFNHYVWLICLYTSVCTGLSHNKVSSFFFITGQISCSYHLFLTSNSCVLHIF